MICYIQHWSNQLDGTGYILDEFASKISDSLYRDSLVLKGGFIVSNLHGIDNRTTKDIDLTFSSTIYSQEQIRDSRTPATLPPSAAFTVPSAATGYNCSPKHCSPID